MLISRTAHIAVTIIVLTIVYWMNQEDQYEKSLIPIILIDSFALVTFSKTIL